MKKSLFILIAFLLVLVLGGCRCEHVWQEATCIMPKTCTECGATEDEALGHKWKDATCTTPQICVVCDATGDEAKGHNWINATCTTAKTCEVCQSTEGEALGHRWEKATCKTPKRCVTCDVTEGEKGDHAFVNFVCEYCGKEDIEGKKTSPLYSFVKGHYYYEGFKGEDYVICSIDFSKAIQDGKMGASWVSYSPDALRSFDQAMDKIIGGKAYYWNGGNGAIESWMYDLSEKEITVRDSKDGSYIARFTLNSDGSIYCVYSGDFRAITGGTYTRR